MTQWLKLFTNASSDLSPLVNLLSLFMVSSCYTTFLRLDRIVPPPANCSIATSLAAYSFFSISTTSNSFGWAFLETVFKCLYRPSKWLLVCGSDGIGTTSSWALFLRLLLICTTWELPLHGCDHWSVEGVPLPELLFLQGMYTWSIKAWSSQT